MIVADSSVWIEFFRARQSPLTDALRRADAEGTILVPDIVLLEIVRGVQNTASAVLVEESMGRFPIVSALNPILARLGARNYRTLRTLGITVCKTASLIIGTSCIEHGHVLLHADRDFDPMALHLGLRTL